MAVPTYDELLVRFNMKKSVMKLTFDDKHLRQFSLTLDTWEKLARFLEMPSPVIANIKSQGDVEEQKIRMLECWKQRCGSMATYEAMVKVLLQIGRTDLAEKVITSRRSSLETDIVNQNVSYAKESSLTAPTSPGSNCEIKDASSSAAMSSLSLSATPSEHTAHEVISTLRELEEEFYDLVTYVEDTLESSQVSLNTITRRFRMLPQSVRRQHQTDESYKETRRRILDSETVKKLFDNLTELKHWNYMTPETLAHILKDVKIDDIHEKVSKYKDKLMVFKANTKLRELINTSFPVPDYCMELTIEVEGWEDKTIKEVENRAVNIVRQATHTGSPHVSLGWKGVSPGSIKLIFIFMKSVKLISEKLLKDNGVASVQVDGDIFHSKDFNKATSSNKEVPSRLWSCSTATTIYNSAGGRDILILAPDLSVGPHPEAVARRPGQLTEKDKRNLQSQGLPPDFQNELAIVKAKYELAPGCKIVEVLSGESLFRENVIESISHYLHSTRNDGVVLYYIGAGRRDTGDWCFEDGFITFRDIAQLYLTASHNFKGRVLTIVSDCSYSGCWVRDCMEFLDKQGVQPCGHKAREKGMVIKVLTSCKFNEIPTKSCYCVIGMSNDQSTGAVKFKISKQLLETQTTASIDSSHLNCMSKTIDEPCTLSPDLTWQRLNEMKPAKAKESGLVKRVAYY